MGDNETRERGEFGTDPDMVGRRKEGLGEKETVNRCEGRKGK